MPAAQINFSERRGVATAGMSADMSNYNAVTYLCETVAGIPFGRAVSQGVGDKGAVIGGDLAKIIGITLKDITLVPMAADQIDKYLQRQNMAVLSLGPIWVIARGIVAAGDPVYFDATTGELSSTDLTDSVGPIVGAAWKTSAANGQLAVVNLGIQQR